MKDQIAAIKFSENSCCVRYYDPAGVEVNIGDFCVVEFEETEEVGFVAGIEGCPPKNLEKKQLPKILRKATPQEIEEWTELKIREQEAMNLCKEKVKKHNLNMKITNVYFDKKNNKVVFNFIADKRVDFRELVKDLAASLKSRIDLWQIGVRDEAKILCGFGVCGQPLCCTRFIKKFKPISIKMAKEQDIFLSPTKLSGVCGRLMCCLQYEYDCYQELNKKAPPVGATIETQKKLEGLVIERNLLKNIVVIEDSQQNRHKVDIGEIVSFKVPENLEKKQRELMRMTVNMEEESEEIPTDDVPESAEPEANK